MLAIRKGFGDPLSEQPDALWQDNTELTQQTANLIGQCRTGFNQSGFSTLAYAEPRRAGVVHHIRAYELTMLQAYFERGMNGLAVFELFVRKLPPQRNFLVAAGLEQAIGYLTALHLRDDDRDWLRQSGRFTTEFIASLADLRFTG